MKECCNSCKYNIEGECTVESLSVGIHPAYIPTNVANYYRCSQYENKNDLKKRLVEGKDNE